MIFLFDRFFGDRIALMRHISFRGIPQLVWQFKRRHNLRITVTEACQLAKKHGPDASCMFFDKSVFSNCMIA